MAMSDRFVKAKASDLKKLQRETNDLGFELAMRWEREYPNYPKPGREFLFHPTLGYRLDLAWDQIKVAIEGEGGILQGKASHSSVSGILRDIDKYNLATTMGWDILRVHRKMLDNGRYSEIFIYVANQLSRRRWEVQRLL